MKSIFSTFCFTSLLWCGAVLYCFATGHIERHTPDYAEALQAAALPVHLARR